MSLTKVNPNLLEGVKWTFDTVSDMKLESRLVVGDRVRTLGYTSSGDGGGASYVIVAAATGTDDGGSYLDLSGSGLQAELQHNGIIHGEQFGAVDGVEASSQLQAAWNALSVWQNAQPAYTQTWFFHKSNVTIANQVLFKEVGGGQSSYMNMDLRGSAWTATTGGDLTTDKAMLRIRGAFAIMYLGYLNGNKSVACLDFHSAVGSRAFNPEVRNFKGYGIRVRSSVGSFALYNPIITEYQQGDAEYTNQANYTSIGLQCSNGDWTCYNANILFCKECVRLGNDPADATADPVQVHFINGHFVMGNSVEGAANPFIDGVLLSNYATRENHFDNCYFDNGVVNDYTGTLHINGGHYVYNGAAILTEPKIRIWASSPAQVSAPDLRITNLGGLASVGFRAAGGNNWSGVSAAMSSMFTGMSDENTTVEAVQTNYRIYTAEDRPIEHNYRMAGNFVERYQQNNETMDVELNPALGRFFLKSNDVEFMRVGVEAPIFSGAGSPEGVVTSPVGGMYRRTNGGAGTTLYIKESGTGNTGWVAK